MAKKYYSVLTTYGAQLFASAMANRQSVHITQFAVGDGNGRTVQPDSSRTSLIKQVHRANISAISPDPRNDKQIIFELTIPENIGGFWIREMGIYDVNNRLVAYANCPETYKPLLAEGSGKIQVMRMILLVSSSNAVTLTIDDSIIFATRGQLTPLTITATSRNGINNTGHSHQIDHASLTQKGIVQLTNDTGVESEALALTAKAGKKLAQQIAQNTLAINQKVSLTGNEKIQGSKTFTGQLKAVGSLVLSSSEGNNNAGHYAAWYADANTTWLVFKGHTFRWHSDGRFSVDNLRFFSELHKPRFADLLNTPTTLAGYGIGNFKVETFNGDMNTLRTDGHYCITSAANSRNLPVQVSGNLQVITGGTGNERYCHQVFRRHYSKETYARYQVSGSNDAWSPWERTDGVDWNDVRNRPTQGTASTNQRGDVLLTNDTGLDSENLALSAKGAKKLSQEIAQNRQKTVDLANQKVNKSEISDAVNSDSRTQVASSKAVKTAYDKGQAALDLAGRKQSPQTTLGGYGITDAVKLQDMRERNGNVAFDDATPAQLPYGTFVGLSGKASLQNQAANGWKLISKGWGDASGMYSCVRFGITGNRFYFQTAQDYQNWNAPFELLTSGNFSTHLQNSVARRDYSRTINGTRQGQTNNRMQVEGSVTIYPDGRIVQIFHLKAIRYMWFNFDGSEVRLIPLQLWTAMPHKIIDVSVKSLRGQGEPSYAQEAAEWQVGWALRNQGNRKDRIDIHTARFRGDKDEPVDVYVVVEGY